MSEHVYPAQGNVNITAAGISVTMTESEFKIAARGVKSKPGTQGGVTPGELKQYIERIERLMETKSNIAVDINEVYAEAKGNGFDVKTMRQIIRRRRLSTEELAEQQELLELYEHALSSQGDLFNASSTNENEE